MKENEELCELFHDFADEPSCQTKEAFFKEVAEARSGQKAKELSAVLGVCRPETAVSTSEATNFQGGQRSI